MDTKTCLTTRRSVRRFAEKPVARETLEEIVALAAYAPSWKNSQTARYTIVTSRARIEEIAARAVPAHNAAILRGCAALAVESSVEKRSGYERDGTFTTSKGTHWESFDAGVAAQTFCLAAHELGLGTCILGIFDEEKVAPLIGLPEGQRVSALIPVGYPAEEPKAPPRKDVATLARFLD